MTRNCPAHGFKANELLTYFIMDWLKVPNVI
jgi:hypothetical protein